MRSRVRQRKCPSGSESRRAFFEKIGLLVRPTCSGFIDFKGAGFDGRALMSTAKRRPGKWASTMLRLKVGDIDEALAFYGRLFEITLRGKSETSAFVDLGDQFIAFQKGRVQGPDDGRHFGLVVNDNEAVRAARHT